MLLDYSPFISYIAIIYLAFLAAVQAQVAEEGNVPSGTSMYSVPAPTVTDASESAGVKPLVYYPSASLEGSALPSSSAAASGSIASASNSSKHIVLTVCLSVGLSLLFIAVAAFFIIRRRKSKNISLARKRATWVLKSTEWSLDPKEVSQIAGPKDIGNAYPFALASVEAQMPTRPPPVTSIRGD